MSGVPGWQNLPARMAAEKAAAEKKVVGDLTAALGDKIRLSAWTFKPGNGQPLGLLVTFNYPAQAEARLADLHADIQLTTPIETNGAPLFPNAAPNALELWGPSDPYWMKAYDTGNPGPMAEMVSGYLVAALTKLRLDCRKEFCKRVPVTDTAGYHSTLQRGYIAFFLSLYAHSTFVVFWYDNGAAKLIKFECKGIEQVPGEDKLFVDAGTNSIKLKDNVRRTILITSLDPPELAERY
jgi:hypothetical protein